MADISRKKAHISGDGEKVNNVVELAKEMGLDALYEESTATLTPRELEVEKYVAKGLLNKEIAYELGISEQTVKNHLTSIYGKRGINGHGARMQVALRHLAYKGSNPQLQLF